jgi:predicted enzyme related to lactoylglutathione lyase
MPVADKVVHFELPADNLERAQNFYRSAFDWSINTVPGMGYTLLQTTLSGKDGRPTEPGAINGGMLARQAPIKNPVLTIQVASIDDSLKQSKSSAAGCCGASYRSATWALPPISRIARATSWASGRP